ncbi:hypothetical protein K7432_014532 [Basidiobolus ranarum]|uniref:EKC/KEOPS complex subunit GON7 n=1 Tax=Basidiobolus ranarum TaxID=34480 RepID=A0ABR2VPD6_9FUNG
MQIHSVHKFQGKIEKETSIELDAANYLPSLADSIKKLQAETNEYLTALMKKVGVPEEKGEEIDEGEEGEGEDEEEDSSPEKKKLRVEEN